MLSKALKFKSDKTCAKLINSFQEVNYMLMLTPQGFFGFEVLLEMLFAIIIFIVATMGFKIYRITSQSQAFYLSWAFLLIGISKVFESILNILIITKLNENICQVAKINSVHMFNNIGMYIHILFMIVGLSLLTFMTFKSEEIRGFLLIVGLSLISIFVSNNILYSFFTISSFLLIIVSWFFIKNYLRHKNTKTLLIGIAFLFLLFGNIHFLFAVNHSLFYIIGLVLELIAYGLILSNFFMVLKR